MADTQKVNVRNTTNGIRGLNALTGYVEFDAGKGGEVELTRAEYENAKSTGYFEFGGSGADSDEGGDEFKMPTTHAGLDELAGTMEGFAFPADTTTVKQKQEAIAAARAAAAAGGSGGAPAADELDKMDDDALRNTVAAITGRPVTDFKDADRAGLLKLARGEE